MVNMLSRSVILSLTLVVSVAGLRAQTPSVVDPSSDAVFGQMEPTGASFSPSGAITVRFTLWNRSSGTVEIAYYGDEPDGVSLPLDVVLGGAHGPSLFVARHTANFETVRAEPPTQVMNVLRIAPHSSVGVEIDLSTLDRAFRINGDYRLEWRPLGGKLTTVTTEFRVEPRKLAVLVTDYGKITFTLEYDKAPKNVENFLELVRTGFYDGKVFHRIIAADLIQGGDPKGDGTGIRPDGKLVPAEFHPKAFTRGTLAMARKPSDPNSASCQFMITLSRRDDMDNQYTVIGEATDDESSRTLNKLSGLKTDAKHRPVKPVVIRSINLIDAPEDIAANREINLSTSQPAGR